MNEKKKKICKKKTKNKKQKWLYRCGQITVIMVAIIIHFMVATTLLTSRSIEYRARSGIASTDKLGNYNSCLVKLHHFCLCLSDV